MSDNKYTLWESFTVFLITPLIVVPAVVVIYIIMLPFGLLMAWIRWMLMDGLPSLTSMRLKFLFGGCSA